MGHDVTLFASGDRITSATLAPMRDQALRLDPTVIDWVAIYMQMIERIYRRADEFDIIHFHIDHFPLALFSRQRTPFLTTRSTAGSTSRNSRTSTNCTSTRRSFRSPKTSASRSPG